MRRVEEARRAVVVGKGHLDYTEARCGSEDIPFNCGLDMEVGGSRAGADAGFGQPDTYPKLGKGLPCG